MKICAFRYSGYWVVVLGLLSLGLSVSARTIPEPPTVVYGRVVRLAGGREFPVVSGTLAWTLRAVGETGRALTLSTGIEAAGADGIAYRLRIPHEARIAGETAGPDVVPLNAEEVLHELVDVTIDGVPARALQPGNIYLALSQNSRAKAWRVDVVLGGDLADSDGDGMPDIWENAFGLNPDIDDAEADNDGDGLSNRREYALGTHPNRDNRIPALMSTNLTAYAGCRTGIRLDIIDADTAPESIVLTLVRAPAGGRLLLRRSGGEATLRAGDHFSLADVRAGKLVFEELSNGTAPRELALSLHDGDAAHQPVPGTATLSVVRPAKVSSPWESKAPAALAEVVERTGRELPVDRTRQLAWLAGHWFGRTIWTAEEDDADAEISVSTGAAVVLGSRGDDVLNAGPEADILAGGAGADTLAGGSGADIFLFDQLGSGADTVADFNAAEGDVLDLSAVLHGSSTTPEDYLQVVTVGNDIILGIDADGDGSGFDDGSITLTGAASGFDLRSLWAAGNILVAGMDVPTVVDVTVLDGDGDASENGPVAGAFTLRRQGPLAPPLTVSISLGGSALNGADYEQIPESITFPAGAAAVTVPVRPQPDYVIEPTETVVLSLLPGSGYSPGRHASATVSIGDLTEIVTVEAVRSEAFLTGLRSGSILIRRSGMISRPAEIWLGFSGDAVPGEDIAVPPARIAFEAWQTAAYLDIEPLPDARIDGGREAVVVHVLADPAEQYRLGEPAEATVWLYADEAAAVDSNGDGLPDSLDPDVDGLATEAELALGSDPNVPTLVLHAGWNLVAVPGLPAGEQTLEAQLGTDFDGVVWTWQDNHYVQVVDAPMQPGRGYLVMVAADTIIDLPQLQPPGGDHTVAFDAGWNLVGAIRGGNWSGPASTLIYRLDDGEYVPLDQPRLRPMTGYWAYFEEPATVPLP